jgi:hypothetical protein
MAANWNNYFMATLGIADPQLRVAINAQGLTTLDSFLNRKDEDIRQICVNIRRPGEQIPNPNVAIAGHSRTTCYH